MSWDEVFTSLTNKSDLSNEQITWAMAQILEGKAGNDQIKQFLLGLKLKGESASEVSALVAQMYQYAAPINITERAVDTVGTGGDGAHTINISTTAAIIAAAAGAQVLDGLGAIGDGAHAAHEWVDISTLETRSKLLNALIKDLLDD